jgi:prepilin peptidase CpaA
MSIEYLFATAFVFIVIYAVVCDTTRLIIPNWTSGMLILLFFAHALLSEKTPAIGMHLLVAVAVFAACYMLYLARWFAGGDVKLLTAVSLWAGPDLFPQMLFVISILGLLLALAVRGYQRYGFLVDGADGRVARIVPRWAKHGLCPYGFAIGLGALAFVPKLFP